MKRLLAYVPLALATVLATASPAQALAVCETATLLTGDRISFCVDTTGSCVFIAATSLNPPAPQFTICQPNVLPGSPPYCDGLVGDVTTYVCFDDFANCPPPDNGISVLVGVFSPPTMTCL